MTSSPTTLVKVTLSAKAIESLRWLEDHLSLPRRYTIEQLIFAARYNIMSAASVAHTAIDGDSDDE